MTERITYGYGTISFSIELLQQIITKGWHVEKLECIEGLPENAEFQRVFSDVNGDISFVFRLPDLEDNGLYVPDKYLPRLRATWRQGYPRNDATISFPDGTKLCIHSHEREDPVFSSNVKGASVDYGLLPMKKPLEYEVEILT